MNSNANQIPGLGLPQPSFEIAQTAVAPDTVESLSMPEASVSRFELDPNAAQAKATQLSGAAQSAQPVAIPAAPAPNPSQPLPTKISDAPIRDVPIQPDDDDALDEEWVNKARDIVARTHNDPYLQSREISKIKAQYIKVRYNKDIKSNDD